MKFWATNTGKIRCTVCFHRYKKKLNEFWHLMEADEETPSTLCDQCKIHVVVPSLIKGANKENSKPSTEIRKGSTRIGGLSD